MRRCATVALLLLSLLSVGSLGDLQQVLQKATKNRQSFEPDFDALVETTIRQWHVPGLSIAVIENGKITSKGYGYAILQEKNATADTQYMTGSTTKAFTAAAAALLVHDKECYPDVKWTTPINNFIRDDFVLENEYTTNHVTIEDALVHSAGLPRHDLVHGQPGDTVKDVTRKLRYLPLTAEPRRKHQYCPIMYGVVTYLLETITGRTLAEQLNHSFWTPLGMRSTTFTPPSDPRNLARGYYWHKPEARYVPEPYDNLTSISGSGDIFSTVNDYALWIKALLGAGGSHEKLRNDSSPLTGSIVQDLFMPRIVLDEYTVDHRPVLYALGWTVATVWGERIVTHGGGETGFGTQVYMLPDKQYGIVTMANTELAGAVAGAVVASHLIRHKLNLRADSNERDLVSLAQKKVVHKEPTNTIPPTRIGIAQPKTLPPPLPIADFAGLYSHPAYGPIDLTFSHANSAETEFLEALFYPRTWPLKLRLTHISSTVFSIAFFAPHGLGNATTGEGIVWEGEDDKSDFRAVFELGDDGLSVERVGMELEIEMVAMARRLGDKEWRKGMIWFDKI